jgi:hypothetical protein
VDEASERVSPPNTVKSDDGVWFRGLSEGRLLVEGTVGAMLVVVTDVDREDSFEVPSVHDQNPVETFAPDAADPTFDEGVRAGCPYRCADCSDAVGSNQTACMKPGAVHHRGLCRPPTTHTAS